MNTSKIKQPALKPQDLLVVLKIAVSQGEAPSFAVLAKGVSMSVSEVHAAVQRAVMSHLLERVGGALMVNRASLQEFLLYGAKYAFPAVMGAMARGMPTGVSAPSLRQGFEHGDAMPLVWPDPQGDIRGVSMIPLYSSAPEASRNDERLYHALAALDALRGGAARERELATRVLINITA